MQPEFRFEVFYRDERVKVFFKKIIYGPFLWMGFNYFEDTEPLRGES